MHENGKAARAGRGSPGRRVQSPCIGVCVIDIDNHCRGCQRSIGEIREWPAADDSRRRTIWQNLAARAKAKGLVPPPGAPAATPGPERTEAMAFVDKSLVTDEAAHDEAAHDEAAHDEGAPDDTAPDGGMAG